MLGLFAGAIFVGALLLFLVQPMAARMVLPSLGGSPAVWNTCMVFFQGLLLAGYGYAHWAMRSRVRGQVGLHFVVLLLPLAALPIALRGGAPAGGGSPIPWLLTALALSVGLPFLVVSTGAPLLQRWLVASGHPSGRDPYFLYAASNAGSLLALLAYPLVMEPLLTLRQQQVAWSAGYGVLAALTAGCGVMTLRRTRSAPAPTRTAAARDAAPVEVVTWRRRLFWVAAAAVPSSYLLAVTQYLSTDIAAVPLLWVVPLALYLITFIIAFASRPAGVAAFLTRIVPLLTIGLAVALVMSAKNPVWLVLLLHLLTFFAAALLCHTRLAGSRPGPDRLTEFYLLIALGGVLGGMFNALLAPVAFRSLTEYPVAMAAACLFRVRELPPARGRPAVNLLLDAAVGGAMVLIIVLLLKALVVWLGEFLADSRGDVLGLSQGQFALLVVIGVPAVIVYVLSRWPVRFAFGLGVLLWIGTVSTEGRVLHVERTFFGVYHVKDRATFRMTGKEGDPAAAVTLGPRLHMLVHGTTEHGAQFQDDKERLLPLTYYHRDGPIGRVFEVLGGRIADRAAFVGMGTGSLAAYGEAGRHFTFFEIDPAVVRIATNPAWFSYLSDAQARGLEYDVVLGDGRMSLRTHAAEGEFGLIVLDAFTSDAIPVHLLTREATEMYLSKLRPGGILAFHISNVYLDLAPVVGRIAGELRLSALDMNDSEVTEEEQELGRSRSHWVMLARSPRDFGDLAADPRWRPLVVPRDAPRWTDDYTSILGIFRWR